MKNTQKNILSISDIEIATNESAIQIYLAKNAKNPKKMKNIDAMLMGFDDDDLDDYAY